MDAVGPWFFNFELNHEKSDAIYFPLKIVETSEQTELIKRSIRIINNHSLSYIIIKTELNG